MSFAPDPFSLRKVGHVILSGDRTQQILVLALLMSRHDMTDAAAPYMTALVEMSAGDPDLGDALIDVTRSDWRALIPYLQSLYAGLDDAQREALAIEFEHAVVVDDLQGRDPRDGLLDEDEVRARIAQSHAEVVNQPLVSDDPVLEVALCAAILSADDRGGRENPYFLRLVDRLPQVTPGDPWGAATIEGLARITAMFDGATYNGQIFRIGADAYEAVLRMRQAEQDAHVDPLGLHTALTGLMDASPAGSLPDLLRGLDDARLDAHGDIYADYADWFCGLRLSHLTGEDA